MSEETTKSIAITVCIDTKVIVFLPIQHRCTIVKELSITVFQTVISESLMYLSEETTKSIVITVCIDTKVIVFLPIQHRCTIVKDLSITLYQTVIV